MEKEVPEIGYENDDPKVVRDFHYDAFEVLTRLVKAYHYEIEDDRLEDILHKVVKKAVYHYGANS